MSKQQVRALKQLEPSANFVLDDIEDGGAAGVSPDVRRRAAALRDNADGSGPILCMRNTTQDMKVLGFRGMATCAAQSRGEPQVSCVCRAPVHVLSAR